MFTSKNVTAVLPLTLLFISSVAIAQKHAPPSMQIAPVDKGPGAEKVIRRITNTTGLCQAIQNAINVLPPEGGEVFMGPGTYTCTEPVVIDRDNVKLRGSGAGTILRLANGANAPVLIIGQTLNVPTATRSNITVSDVVIDGNRANQTFECLRGECSASNPLRNNAITLRRVSDVTIERVAVFGARSGGLVSELICRRLTITNFTSSDNHFDGLAGYETEDSVFTKLYLHHNLAAGFSFDIAFNKNLISDTVLADNAKVGIFMRDARDNVFHGLQIRNSGEHGVFLAQVDTDATKPAAGNIFTALMVSGSQGAGVRVNDLSCVNNSIVSSQFVGNSGGCISEASPGLALASANICR
jgi:hypothetical protein